jgi:hypothetical protein
MSVEPAVASPVPGSLTRAVLWAGARDGERPAIDKQELL